MLLDRQLHIAEDRCRDNAAHLGEKGAENSKLQSALAQQTKVSVAVILILGGGQCFFWVCSMGLC